MDDLVYVPLDQRSGMLGTVRDQSIIKVRARQCLVLPVSDRTGESPVCRSEATNLVTRAKTVYI